MKTNMEALGALTGLAVVVLILIVATLGTAVLAGLWFRIFLDVAGLA